MDSIISQTGNKTQGLNGPVFITEAGEWAVYLDGEHIGWASNELAAERRYAEALVARRAHYQRNQANREADNA